MKAGNIRDFIKNLFKENVLIGIYANRTLTIKLGEEYYNINHQNNFNSDGDYVHPVLHYYQIMLKDVFEQPAKGGIIEISNAEYVYFKEKTAEALKKQNDNFIKILQNV